MRRKHWTPEAQRKTHCKHGHDISVVGRNVWGDCTVCSTLRKRKYTQKQYHLPGVCSRNGCNNPRHLMPGGTYATTCKVCRSKEKKDYRARNPVGPGECGVKGCTRPRAQTSGGKYLTVCRECQREKSILQRKRSKLPTLLTHMELLPRKTAALVQMAANGTKPERRIALNKLIEKGLI